MRVALTIAGSDSGGGAGIQADLKSMQANGVFAASVITAVTAQNTRVVTAAFELPIEIIEAQIDAVMSDIEVDATKTGMLSSIAIIEAVARKVREHWMFPLVVDPVMISKSGFPLLKPNAVETLRTNLLPLATVVTPNAYEAERLAEMSIRTADDAAEAARRIRRLGPEAVLVKGGHLEGEEQAIDVLFDGRDEHRFASPRIDTPHTHGTGCTYASAIAANLAKGHDLVTAVREAKRYVTGAIEHGLPIGRGHGPTHHFWHLEPFGVIPDED
ncbi:MAG: bifunctional hydroxymethylpyrimidine kinase/phosphomethylpyrimidine kinase [Deltaproteobacteria bacterium]|nr:bifunctional hydroxymethylpyrimidine kinase/phosphomethylpyrimidine kinase [Deltaproteobacteria bacterium]